MPTNVLVSGAPERIAPVSKVLRDHDCTVVEVGDLGNVPAACEEAGENAFDAYLQMPAYFAIQGTTALERLHHFYAKGVLARFPAMNAAVPSLKPGGRITIVAWPLPAEVATDDDIEARRALYPHVHVAARRSQDLVDHVKPLVRGARLNTRRA